MLFNKICKLIFNYIMYEMKNLFLFLLRVFIVLLLLLVGINSMMMQNLTALAAASSSGGNAGIHGLAAGGKFMVLARFTVL